MKKYFSQYRQDEFLDKVVFNKKRNGFFVDIGAHDGISLSNSIFFEVSRSFDGLCVEPNPKVFKELKKNRKCEVLNACIADSIGIVKFLAIDGYAEMLSGIIDYYHPKHLERIDVYLADHGGSKKEIEVKSLPLQAIAFLHNKRIDFISIDTEGNELNILKSIDFDQLDVNCFTIENNYGSTEIEEIMCKNGYTKVYRLGDDDIYLLRNEINTRFKLRRWIFQYLSGIKHFIKKVL